MTTISHAELADRLGEIAGELHDGDSDVGFLRNAAYLLRKQRAEIEWLTSALKEIARQHLIEEMDDQERDYADFEGGYDACVKQARAALSTPN